MSLDKFEKIIAAYIEINGREINITGGEPLLHPKLKDILKISNSFSKDVTLSTNGMLLDSVKLNPNKEKITETKISLHYFDNQKASRVMGKNYQIDIVKKNIVNHISKGYKTIINTTLTSDNEDDIYEIVNWCTTIGANIKISDLGETKDNSEFFSEYYYPPEKIIHTINKFSDTKKILDKRAGNNLTQYFLTNGGYILIKDVKNGKYCTKMCDDCNYYNSCSEGVFALRVNPNGNFQPCALRKELIIPNSKDGFDLENMIKAISVMMNGVGYDTI